MSILPDAPRALLDFVGKNVWPGRSWVTPLAAAAGVHRQTVHAWPPADVAIMEKHLLLAVEQELLTTQGRIKIIEQIRDALRERVGRKIGERG